MTEDKTPFDIDYIDELEELQGCDEAEGSLETRDVTAIIVRWVMPGNKYFCSLAPGIALDILGWDLPGSYKSID